MMRILNFQEHHMRMPWRVKQVGNSEEFLKRVGTLGNND